MKLDELESTVGLCTLCNLYKGRTCPVFAKGDAESSIMVCGMAPEKEENKIGVPFVGRSGKILDKVLNETRCNPYITNLVKCFVPAKIKLEQVWINSCNGYLQKQINLIKPRVIIALGKDVSNILCNNKASLKSMRGSLINMGAFYVMPTYHPSYLGRIKEANIETLKEDFKKAISISI